MSGGRVHVGTSGWTYKHWRGVFYPEDVPQRRWLEHYQQHFSTVELNATFYRLPQEQTFRRWAERSPDGFRFAVKGSRFITHMKRLRDAEDAALTFLSRARLLGGHLGPVLWQLPPSLERDIGLLREFVRLLPDDLTHAFEFRHRSWFADETYELLRERDCAFCTYHMRSDETPVLATADCAYVRFHGTESSYGGGYSDEAIRVWAQRIGDFLDGGREVWAYFNNDAGGHAVADARRLRAAVAGG